MNEPRRGGGRSASDRPAAREGRSSAARPASSGAGRGFSKDKFVQRASEDGADRPADSRPPRSEGASASTRKYGLKPKGEGSAAPRAPRSEAPSSRGPRPDARSDSRPDSREPRGERRERPSGDRPYNRDRPAGDRPYNRDRPAGDRPFNRDKPAGDRPYNRDKPAGDRPYNRDRPAGDRPFNRDKPAGDRSFNRDKPAGDRPYNRDKPAGDRPFNRDRPAGDRPFNRDKPAGDRPFNRDRPPGDRPYNRDKPAGDRPYNRDKPAGDRPFNRDRPAGDRPFNRDRPAGDRPYNRDRPAGDRPFNRDRPDGDRPFNRDRPSVAGAFGRGKVGSKRPSSFTENALRRETERVHKRVDGVRTPLAKNDGLIRLNKFIAAAGICSRREADVYIEDGRISVNGVTVSELGYKVKPTDEIRLGGKLLRPEKQVYILLNKPKNYITTLEDEEGRQTVMDLVANAVQERLYPVGRLDRNTTGLLILTNDGELADRLMHPSFEIRKVYQVELDKPLSDIDFGKIRAGLMLEDGKANVDDMAILSPDRKSIGLEIHIGRNRIVRRIFEALDYMVVKLDRVMYGGLTKKDLPRGRYRMLSQQEVINLKHLGSASVDPSQSQQKVEAEAPVYKKRAASKKPIEDALADAPYIDVPEPEKAAKKVKAAAPKEAASGKIRESGTIKVSSTVTASAPKKKAKPVEDSANYEEVQAPIVDVTPVAEVVAPVEAPAPKKRATPKKAKAAIAETPEVSEPLIVDSAPKEKPLGEKAAPKPRKPKATAKAPKETE